MCLCFVTSYYSPLNFNCITGIRFQLRTQINSVFLKINLNFLFLHGFDFPDINIHFPDFNILDFFVLAKVTQPNCISQQKQKDFTHYQLEPENMPEELPGRGANIKYLQSSEI